MLELAITSESQDNLLQTVDLLEDIKKFFYRIGDVSLEKKVSEMSDQINEPLYMVVVGEYNAGKSSFINALCGEKILSCGPTPSTNKITLITYGEQTTTEDVDDNQNKMTYPLEDLKEITIVDTPGTNSIIVEHQQITENFIHRAELVLFVTSADHPFTESERVFLQLLKGKWGRKILIILNKIDLKTENELKEITTFIEKNFYRLFAFEPKVIPVSTKDAYEAKILENEELLEKSNINQIEDFIFEKLDLDTKTDLKILSPLKYLLNVFSELQSELDNKVTQCNSEIKSVELFEKRLNNKKQDMRDYILKHKSEIESAFARLKEKVDSFMNYYVNIRSVITMKFAREKIEDKFKREVFGFENPRSELDRIANDAMEYVDRNNVVLWDMAHDYIESDVTLKRQNDEVSQKRKERYFAGNKAEKNFNLKDYANQFRELDGDLESERIHSVVQSGFINFVILEGLAITIIIGLSTFLSIFIPGILGVVVAVILAGAGLAIYPQKRRKYKNEFFKKIDDISDRFNKLMLFEFEKVVDRVIEDIGNKISAFRDTRWSEREEVNRQRSDLKLLSERTKNIIRKSSQK